MSDAAFIAIDWGTTNRRIYAIDLDGNVVATERDDCGVLAMQGADYPSEVAAIRTRLGHLPVLCAGMVGSARGWALVPYIACPASNADLADALHWIEPGYTAIVPGVSTIVAGRGDVMRSEDVQVLGAIMAGLAPDNALFCQPGTHCKWVQMADGAIADFRTTMTGELFALLTQHSLLADAIRARVVDGPAFREGVKDAAQGRLLGNLFGVRANDLLGLRDSADAASYTSGLVIGSDVSEQHLAVGQVVHLLASGDLGALYATAIESVGGRVVALDSHDAFVAGITNIWSGARAS